MGCATSKSAVEVKQTGTSPILVEGGILPKKTPNMSAERTKAFHSAIRWGKTDEVEQMIKELPQLIEATDPVNGNGAIHIASQNGHLDLVKLLIKNKVDVNKQNGGGQTALHMAYSYDLTDVTAALKAAGADGSITNEDGHQAVHGLSGEKDPDSIDFKMNALKSAKSTKTLITAMDVLIKSAASVDKALVVQMALKAKREQKDQWTPDVQAKLGELMTALG